MTTKDPVIGLSPRERRELFDQAGRAKVLPAVLIEKDFWVCWTLHQLFGLPGARENMIFKGGTSLSKVWGAIERCSEDLDISLSREWLGFGGDKDPEKASSRKQRGRLLEDLSSACAAKVRDEILPSLNRIFSEQLGPDGWTLEIDPEDSQTVLFMYPTALDTASTGEYVRRIVKIEGGARSDRWPVEMGRVTSFVAELFPKAAAVAAEIPILSAERTFWEKATILHAEAHRPADKATPARFSRHYSDLAVLAGLESGKRALEPGDLRERVVIHKQIFFPASWASMDTAVPGQFKLIPSPERLVALEHDYQDMRQMFFKTPPKWSEIVLRLRELEQAINAAKH